LLAEYAIATMGLSEQDIVDPECISASLRCPVCTDLYDDPVFCGGNPCQHVFCTHCIEQALITKRACPVCRAQMSPRNLQAHLGFKAMLDEVFVHCSRHCGWTGRRDARSGHDSSCPVVLLEEQEARFFTWRL